MDEDRQRILFFVPLLLGLAGVVLLALPLRLFEGTVPTPLLPLVVIYFWTIYAPEYVPSWATFLVGLLQDFLLGGILGIWAGTYLVTQLMILSQRDYFLGRDQLVVWLGFALSASAAGFAVWLILSVLSGSVLTVWPVVWQIAVTIAFYPVPAVLFSGLHERVIREPHAP